MKVKMIGKLLILICTARDSMFILFSLKSI